MSGVLKSETIKEADGSPSTEEGANSAPSQNYPQELPKVLVGHFNLVHTDDGPRVQCKRCLDAFLSASPGATPKRPKAYSQRTSSSNHLRHLAKVHNVDVHVKHHIHPSIKPERVNFAENEIVKLFTETLRPFRPSENRGVVDFLKGVLPWYEMMGAGELQERTQELYNLLKVKLVEQFKGVDTRFTITFDGWVTPEVSKCFVVSLHWIQPEPLQQCSIILDLFQGTAQYANEICAGKLECLIREFGLEEKQLACVTRDSSLPIQAAMEQRKVSWAQSPELNLYYLDCWADTIDSCINDTIKVFNPYIQQSLHLVEMIKFDSQLHQLFLAAQKKVSKAKPLELPSPNGLSNWINLYQVLKKLLSLAPALEEMKNHVGFNNYILSFPTPEVWSLINSIVEFLELPVELVSQLGSDAPLSNTITSYDLLLLHFNAYQSQDPKVNFLQQAAADLMSQLRQCEEKIKSRSILIACFLDPRISTEIRVTETSIRYVREELNSARYWKSHNPPPTAKLSTAARMWEMRYSSTTPYADSEETQMFVSIQGLPMDTNLLGWWSDHQNKFPTLFKMALDYLFIPPSVIPSLKRRPTIAALKDSHSRFNSLSFKSQVCAKSWGTLMAQLDLPITSCPKDEITKIRSIMTGIVPTPDSKRILDILDTKPDPWESLDF